MGKEDNLIKMFEGLLEKMVENRKVDLECESRDDHHKHWHNPSPKYLNSNFKHQHHSEFNKHFHPSGCGCGKCDHQHHTVSQHHSGFNKHFHPSGCGCGKCDHQLHTVTHRHSGFNKHFHPSGCGCGKCDHQHHPVIHHHSGFNKHFHPSGCGCVKCDHQHHTVTHHHSGFNNHLHFSHCGCGKGHHDGFNHGFFHGHHHNSPFNGHFLGSKCVVPFKVSPFCFSLNNNFRLNFNGLNGNLAFQLFRFKGCRVKVAFECAGTTDVVEGIICNIGTNFVDILKDNHKVVTIMIERICKLEWLDKHCNPCPVCFNPCDFDHVCRHCGEKDKDDEEDTEEDAARR